MKKLLVLAITALALAIPTAGTAKVRPTALCGGCTGGGGLPTCNASLYDQEWYNGHWYRCSYAGNYYHWVFEW